MQFVKASLEGLQFNNGVMAYIVDWPDDIKPDDGAVNAKWDGETKTLSYDVITQIDEEESTTKESTIVLTDEIINSIELKL